MHVKLLLPVGTLVLVPIVLAAANRIVRAMKCH